MALTTSENIVLRGQSIIQLETCALIEMGFH